MRIDCIVASLGLLSSFLGWVDKFQLLRLLIAAFFHHPASQRRTRIIKNEINFLSGTKVHEYFNRLIFRN